MPPSSNENIDLIALRVFKTVVDEGGISAAARKLHRVQSNVTTRIQQLEETLGTALFVREKRRLHLSRAGELFLDYAEQLLDTWERARDALLDDTPRGVLRLGTLESTAASRLPPLLARYHARHREVRVELTTGTTDALVSAVLARELEAAFVADCDAAPPLQAVEAFREQLVLVAPRSHPPIRRARDVRADTAVCFPTGCAYRRRLQRWLGDDGIAPERSLELGSYHAIVACVASGAGIAVVPRSVLRTVAGVPRGGSDVAVYPLGRGHGRTVTSLIWLGEAPSVAVRALSTELARGRRRKAAARRG